MQEPLTSVNRGQFATSTSGSVSPAKCSSIKKLASVRESCLDSFLCTPGTPVEGGPCGTEARAVAAGGGPHMSGNESLPSLSSSLESGSVVAMMCLAGASCSGSVSCFDSFFVGSLRGSS